MADQTSASWIGEWSIKFAIHRSGRSRRGASQGVQVLQDPASRAPTVKEDDREVMKNPLIHGLVLIIAVVIPGGLLVYFAWRIKKARNNSTLANKENT
jgi:hypothetical protein